ASACHVSAAPGEEPSACPADCDSIHISRCGSGASKGRQRTAQATANTPMATPSPAVNVKMTASGSPGRRFHCRSVMRTSVNRLVTRVSIPSAPLTSCLEPPVESEDREDALLLAELLAV